MDKQKENKSKKNLFKLNSVKKKLIVGMTAMAIVPTIALGVVSNQYAHTEMEKQISNATTQMNNVTNDSIDNYLLGVEAQLEMASKNINFTTFYDNPNNAEYGFFLLEGTQKSREDYQYVYFASAKKDIVMAPKEDMPDNYDPTSRDWYKDAVKANGKMVIGEPYQDAVTKEMVVTASQAVLNNGEAVGVVAIDLDLQVFAKDLNEIKVGDSGYTFILSSKGIAITHKEKAIIGTDEQTKIDLWKDVSKKESGHSEYSYKGVEKFSAFDTNEKTGWKIVSTLEAKEIEDSTKAIKMLSVAMMIGFAVISIGIAYAIGRRIANNLKQIQSAFKNASEGDLTTRVTVDTNDEFKQLEIDFNHMMEELSQALQNVEESSKTVLQTSSTLTAMTAETSASVYEVAQAIGEISQGTTLQADNAQTSVNQISELSQRLDAIATSTDEMNQVSIRSTELGNKGLDTVVVLTEKSNQTKQSTSEVAEIVDEVKSRMEDINKIIETISSITDRTTLLSLNAQIESAHAGEFGKGFAVVANEVRSLAEQSKQSTVEIRQIVENIKNVVSKAVKAMENTQSVVGEQEFAVSETKEIFTNILNSINEVVNKSNEVQEALTESQQNKNVVVAEIESISAVSQQTASATEEVSASAEEISATMEEYNRHANGLQGLSAKLDAEIKKFKLK